jgi:hypothetical protein
MTDVKAAAHGSIGAPLRAVTYVLLVIFMAAFGLYAVFISGPSMRAAAHEDTVRAVAEEDRQFCEMFGMRSGTDAFAACSKQLSIVRQKQVDRDNAAAQGIL